MNITELEIGMRVQFIGGQQWHRICWVGPKYFHIETERGASGPYQAELVAEVEQ